MWVPIPLGQVFFLSGPMPRRNTTDYSLEICLAVELDVNQVLDQQNKAKRLQGHHMFLESMTVGSNTANVAKQQMDVDPKLFAAL